MDVVVEITKNTKVPAIFDPRRKVFARRGLRYLKELEKIVSFMLKANAIQLRYKLGFVFDEIERSKSRIENDVFILLVNPVFLPKSCKYRKQLLLELVVYELSKNIQTEKMIDSYFHLKQNYLKSLHEHNA